MAMSQMPITEAIIKRNFVNVVVVNDPPPPCRRRAEDDGLMALVGATRTEPIFYLVLSWDQLLSCAWLLPSLARKFFG